jgi:hypothetical protein
MQLRRGWTILNVPVRIVIIADLTSLPLLWLGKATNTTCAVGMWWCPTERLIKWGMARAALLYHSIL